MILTHLKNNVSIEANTVVNSFTSIGPNVFIGKNCYIGNNVSICNTYIGNNVIIQDGTLTLTIIDDEVPVAVQFDSENSRSLH